MKNSIKLKRFNKLIQKFLSSFLLKEFDKNYNVITITSVNTSSDFTLIKVSVSSFKDVSYIVKLLNNSSKRIKHVLASKFKLNKLPEIVFFNDSLDKYF